MARPVPSLVQFPRFQYEAPENVETYRRILYHRGEPAHWLRPGIAKLLTKFPSTPNMSEIDEKRKNNWWGVYHVAYDHELPDITVPSAITLQRERFSGVMRKHEYLWDEQAMPGTAAEFILRRHDDQGTEEVLALLQTTSMAHRDLGEYLVLNDGIEWREPSGLARHRAASLLFASSLVMNGAGIAR